MRAEVVTGPAPGSGRLSWGRLLSFGVLVAIMAPVSAVMITLYTDWGRDRLTEAAIELIDQELGLIATFEGVDVELLPRPTLSARGIRLDHPVYGEFATAKGLSIQPSFTAFAAGRLDLQTIHLASPRLRLLVDGDEIVNIPVLETRGDSEPEDLPFQRLIISNAEVSVNAGAMGAGSLRHADLQFDVVDGRKIDFSLREAKGSIRHPMGNDSIQKLAAQGRFTPDQGVEFSHFVFRSPHLSAKLTDAYIPIPFGDDYRFEGRAGVNLAHLDNLPHGLQLPPFEGRLSVEGKVAGSPEGPTALATIGIKEGKIDVQRRGIGDVELEVEVNPEQIRVISGGMQIINNGGYAALSGTIGLQEGFPVDLGVDIQHFRFSRFISQMNVSHHTIVQWDLDGPARLRGTLEPFSLQGPITLASTDFQVTKDPYYDPRQRRVIGATPASIRGRVRVDPEAFRFEGLRAQLGKTHFTSDVHLRFNDTILVTTAGEIDLADATPLLNFPLAGRGPFRVRVEGNYSNPAVNGHLHLQNFAFNGNPLGDVGGDWHLEGGGLIGMFPLLEAEKRDSSYKVNDFTLDFTNDRLAITGQLVASRLSLQDFYHVFHYEEDERFTPYQGVVAGTAQVRFTHGFPGDSPNGTLLADMNLRVRSADLNGFAFDDGRFEGRWHWKDYDQGYRGGELTIRHGHLKKGNGTLTLQGTMGYGGVLRATASADRLRFRDTEGLGDNFPSLSGVFGFNADIAGMMHAPRVTIDAQIAAAGYKRSMLGDAQLLVRMTDRQDPWVREADQWDPANLPTDKPCVQARMGFLKGARWAPDPPLHTRDGLQPAQEVPSAYLVCGTGFGGQLEVDMAIGRTRVYPARGSLRATTFPLGPFLPNVIGSAAPVGSLSGEVFLSDGSLRQRSRLAGKVQVRELNVESEGVALRNEGTVDIGIERGTFTVHQATFVGPASSIDITGSGSERRGLALNINGDVDVGLLAILSPRVTQASGSVSVHANISGPVTGPSVFGQALVQDSSFRYAGFPEPLEELSGVVTFSSRRVLLEDFRARLAGGELSLGGSATVAGLGLQRYALDVAAENVSLRPNPKLAATLSGDARISWSQGERIPHLAGTLRLQQASYEEDVALGQTLGELSQRRRAEVESYNPDQDVLSLDVRVIEEAPLRVNNNLIDADIRIEDSERPFRIVGTDQRLGAIGTLVIPRGIVHFRDAEFTVQRGLVSFDDSESIDPTFDVQATTEIRRTGTTLTGPAWRIGLHAHGTSDSFQLDTSSQPELTQEDIVLLLTMGLTRAEAEQLQAGDIGSTAALEALAAVTGIDREVTDAIRVIDGFSITSRYSPRTGRTEPQITITKRVTDDVRLTGSTGISDSQQVRTAAEWQLDNETSIQVSYDNQTTNTTSGVGNVGADVRWRLEFD